MILGLTGTGYRVLVFILSPKWSKLADNLLELTEKDMQREVLLSAAWSINEHHASGTRSVGSRTVKKTEKDMRTPPTSPKSKPALQHAGFSQKRAAGRRQKPAADSRQPKAGRRCPNSQIPRSYNYLNRIRKSRSVYLFDKTTTHCSQKRRQWGIGEQNA